MTRSPLPSAFLTTGLIPLVGLSQISLLGVGHGVWRLEGCYQSNDGIV